MTVQPVGPVETRRAAPPTGGADFRLLGPVEVVVEGRPIALGGAKQRALLALFVLHANEVLSRDFLIDALWGDDAPSSAEHSIVVYVSRLRKALRTHGRGQSPTLGTEAGGYVLRVAGEQIDVQRFEHALERGGRALAAGDASVAAEILRSACGEWRGEPLGDLVSAPFVEGASWRLAELRLAALGSRIDADLALGRHAELVAELEQLVRDNPLNERLSAQLMVALYRSGRQARALEIYRMTRRVLVDELGLEPGEDLQRLEQAILRHDPDLEAPRSTDPGRHSRRMPADRSESAARRQRKTVSVLAATVAPAWHVVQPDPEALRRATAPYLEAMTAAIERHGGTVERVRDSAVLGLFGSPESHEDDPLRAVRAAVEIRDSAGVRGANEALPGALPLDLRTGVETGPVLAGDPASPVTGRVVGVALELGRAAQPGEILLGAETVRRLDGLVEASPHAPVAGDSGGDPAAALRLERLAPADDASGNRASDSPFVGRTAELRVLRTTFDQAVAQRATRLVTVVGEPGIGKTRLLTEFSSGLGHEARILRGRCLPYGDGITYWPAVGIVRDLGGAAALDDLASRGALDARARELILGVIGGCEPAGSVEETQWAFRRLFETLAGMAPLVVVLDDLHWAEPTFLQLVEYVATCSGGAPIVLLASARDELLEARPTWAVPRLNAQVLPLRELSEQDARSLIDDLAGQTGLGSAQRARITEAAAGNPLFLEQLLADLVDHPAPAGQTGRQRLPATIEALLAARLDRLPAVERDLLERAAVEGLAFQRDTVTALLPQDDRQDVGELLLSTVRRNLVRPQRAEGPGGDSYRFVHPLVREAVYGSMPKELRATLHEQVAERLAGQVGAAGELDEVAGYHLEQAARYRQELGLPDDDLAQRAGDRLAAAGRRALWRGDVSAAASLLGRALELTRPIRLDIHLEVDHSYAVSFDQPRRAAAIAEAAAAQAHLRGDEPGEALARVACADHRLLTVEGDVDELEALARAALPLLEEVADHAGLARVWETLGFSVAQFRGRFEEMAAAGEQAVRHAEVAEQPAGGALETLAMALADGPRPADEALCALDSLLPASPGPILLMWRAWLLAMLERSEEARPSVHRLCEIASEIGAGPGEGMAGMIAALEGDHETAARNLRTLCDMLEERGQRGYLSSFAPQLGRSLYALGRYDEVEPLAQLGRELASARDLLAQMCWRQVQALVDAHRGDCVAAEALAREAVAIGEHTDALNCQADAFCDLAEVLDAQGKHAEAANALVQALDRYERKKNLAMARRVRARLRVSLPADGPEAVTAR